MRELRAEVKDKVERLLKFKISNSRFDTLIKEYNNFEGPISKRQEDILCNPRKFCVYILKDSLVNVIDKTDV